MDDKIYQLAQVYNIIQELKILGNSTQSIIMNYIHLASKFVCAPTSSRNLIFFETCTITEGEFNLFSLNGNGVLTYHWVRKIYPHIQFLSLKFIGPITKKLLDDHDLPENFSAILPNTPFFNSCIEFLIENWIPEALISNVSTGLTPLGMCKTPLGASGPRRMLTAAGVTPECIIKFKTDNFGNLSYPYWKRYILNLLDQCSNCILSTDDSNLEYLFPWLHNSYTGNDEIWQPFRQLLHPERLPNNVDENFYNDYPISKHEIEFLTSELPTIENNQLYLRTINSNNDKLKCTLNISQCLKHSTVSKTNEIWHNRFAWSIKCKLITSKSRPDVNSTIGGFLFKNNMSELLIKELVDCTSSVKDSTLTPTMLRIIIIVCLDSLLE